MYHDHDISIEERIERNIKFGSKGNAFFHLPLNERPIDRERNNVPRQVGQSERKDARKERTRISKRGFSRED